MFDLTLKSEEKLNYYYSKVNVCMKIAMHRLHCIFAYRIHTQLKIQAKSIKH